MRECTFNVTVTCSSVMESSELAVAKKGTVPGVLYFSSIPTGMNVAMLTDELSHFGKINRVYLVPKKSKKKKSQRLYSEGWVEFFKKKNAKEAARALNCVEVPGGKVGIAPIFHKIFLEETLVQ